MMTKIVSEKTNKYSTKTHHFVFSILVNDEDPEEQQHRGKKDKPQANKRLHKQQRAQQKILASKFIDDEVEEDEDSEGDARGGREAAYYDASQLKRQNQPLNLNQMQDKYKNQDFDNDEELEDEYQDQ